MKLSINNLGFKHGGRSFVRYLNRRNVFVNSHYSHFQDNIQIIYIRDIRKFIGY